MNRIVALLALGLLVLTLPSARADPDPPTISCTSPGVQLSMMIVRARSCVRTSVAFVGYDPTDAYYQLMVTVRPEPGFASGLSFKNDTNAGDILKSVFNGLFKVSKPKSLFLSLDVGDGALQEPTLTPISFKYDDAQKVYTSDITLNSVGLRHRLPSGSSLTVKLKALYSDRVGFDPQLIAKVIAPALGATDFLVTAAAKPLLDVAKDAATAALNATSVSADATSTMTFSPALGNSTREELLVVDPRNPQRRIATITLQLVSARSLLADPQNFENGASALPIVAGDGSSVDISLIGKKVVVGQASAWPLPVNAIASATISELPGTATAAQIRTFCSTVRTNLGTQFSLSQLDRLLVTARAVEIATGGSAGRTFNPYRQCFSAVEMAALATYLPGVDVSDPPPPPGPAPTGITDQSRLEALGCWMKGTAGDQCGSLAAMRSRLAGYLDDKIALPSLEGLDGIAEIATNLPVDRIVDREDFLNRFAGRFARFHDYDLGAGTMLVNVTATSPDLTLSGSLKNGKVASLNFQRR